jgi:2-oxo-4-hydroxy-4-carboxy-5-ureidoimidazoline decarboxylase
LIGKEGVLRLHPDLAGRLAELGSLTQESTAEQKAAGLDTMTLGEKQLLRETNIKYDKLYIIILTVL